MELPGEPVQAESAFGADPLNLIRVIPAKGGRFRTVPRTVIFFREGFKMKRTVLLILLMFLVSSLVLSEKLVVYTYDSLLPLAREAFPKFEELTGIEVVVRTYGDAGAVLSKVIAEREKSDVDVVIGIDNLLAKRAFEEDIFLSYKPKNADSIVDKSLIFDPQWRLTPYDYGAIAIIYDHAEYGKLDIESLDQLTEKRFRRSLIIQDPRTSSTGLSFVMWTYLLHQEDEDFVEFWRNLKDSILTITFGWDDAFEKFEAGEAPMMVSYATDGAYSYHYYGKVYYGAIIPGGKGYVQIEGAGICKWTDNLEAAQKFIDFLVSPECQNSIPLNQWMFPVIEIELPEAFNYAVKPTELLSVPENIDIEKIIALWESVIYE